MPTKTILYQMSREICFMANLIILKTNRSSEFFVQYKIKFLKLKYLAMNVCVTALKLFKFPALFSVQDKKRI
jgi:hypothetical protein